MPEPRESLDRQLVDARGSMLVQFHQLIQKADEFEQELAYATLNRDEANARVTRLSGHVEQLRERIRQWDQGNVSDADMMQSMFKWARIDVEEMIQEAADATE